MKGINMKNAQTINAQNISAIRVAATAAKLEQCPVCRKETKYAWTSCCYKCFVKYYETNK